MSIQDEDVRRIGEYVKPWLRDVVQQTLQSEGVVLGPQLLERIVRVEEELRAQRELMDERFRFIADRFGFVDKRFEQLQQTMDQRFTSMDKRFEQLQQTMDQRFTTMDKRFEQLQHAMDRRFELMDKRFESVDKRFESVDKRFDDMHESFKRTQWLIGLGFVLISAVVSLLGVFA